MNAKRIPPKPIFDSLESIGNPFKQKSFSVRSFIADSKQTVGINIDYEYALKFLYSYNGSSATFNAYRRELERFLQWCWRIEEHSILRLKREDIEEYVRFCLNPPMAWIGTKNVPRFLTSSGERNPN